MNFPNRSQKLWTVALILASVVFLLLCNVRPEQLKHGLHKRGDPQGDAGGHQVVTPGDHNSIDNAWGTLPDVSDHTSPGERTIPGPKKEPPFEPCNRRDWVLWLSFGAPHWEFWSHRDARDVSCLKDADWKSDACTGALDRPGDAILGTYDFKTACQRRDFARLNLPDFSTGLRNETGGSVPNYETFIKERFIKDLYHMCNKQHSAPLEDLDRYPPKTVWTQLCWTTANWYKQFVTT